MKNLLLLVLSCMFCSSALANITLSKNRLFFDSKDRADAVQLRNTGNTSIKFETSLYLVQMNEQGDIVKVENSDDSAINMLRFSPKRGVVPSGGKQVIRFSVRRPKNLAAGEYRAVLSVSTSLATEKPEAVTLRSTLKYNMPVIVRHGETRAETELQNLRIVEQNDTRMIELWQTLDGNRSLFGNFTVEDKTGQVVGLLNGVAVYPPLNKRRVLIPLTVDTFEKDLVVNFQEVATYGGIEKAEALISL